MMGSSVSLPIAILMLVWAILTFLVPFFVYGAWVRSKECSEKLTQTNKLLAHLVKTMQQAPRSPSISKETSDAQP